MKNEEVTVIAIGITSRVDKAEINAIASDPDDANAYFVDDFDDLLDVVARIAAQVCGQGITLWLGIGFCLFTECIRFYPDNVVLFIVFLGMRTQGMKRLFKFMPQTYQMSC